MAATGLIDERSRDLLKSLIQVHIATGEPVGSESLSRVLSRKLSPATLRNMMAELERKGYLSHPHTSAGRVPTDEGYRVYVDGLISHQPLPARDAATIDSSFITKDASAGHLFETASRILSRLSHNVGFVLTPDIARATFMHIDLVRLAHPRILVVMVARSGIVTNKVIEPEEDFSQDELQACANYLNTHFAGMSLAVIRARLLELMREDKALYDSLLKRVIAVGQRAFADQEDEASVYLDGTANILEKPEFEDLDRMRALFKTFEEKGRLVKILNACIAGGGIRIVIGHENPDPELHDLALVGAGLALPDETGLGLGVMGSTRMEYARAIALVDHVGRAVQRALAELAE